MDHLAYCDACMCEFGAAVFGDEWQACTACGHGVWCSDGYRCDVCTSFDGEIYCDACHQEHLAFDQTTDTFVCLPCVRQLGLAVDDIGQHSETGPKERDGLAPEGVIPPGGSDG